MPISARERDVYERQMILEGWGEKTQEKLKRSTVFIAGAAAEFLTMKLQRDPSCPACHRIVHRRGAAL